VVKKSLIFMRFHGVFLGSQHEIFGRNSTTGKSGSNSDVLSYSRELAGRR